MPGSPPFKVLTLCGSLRQHSSNRAILQAFARGATGLAMHHYEDIATLPHFNPDLDTGDALVPPAVDQFRRQVSGAAALVISTPEYVHALPGSFKNALDWLVSDPAVIGKPVVILHADRGSTWALNSLREVLRTMTAEIIEPACVLLRLGSNQTDANRLFSLPDLRNALVQSAQNLQSILQQQSSP